MDWEMLPKHFHFPPRWGESGVEQRNSKMSIMPLRNDEMYGTSKSKTQDSDKSVDLLMVGKSVETQSTNQTSFVSVVIR